MIEDSKKKAELDAAAKKASESKTAKTAETVESESVEEVKKKPTLIEMRASQRLRAENADKKAEKEEKK